MQHRARSFCRLIYVVLNPRFTWLTGSIRLVSHILKGEISQPHLSVKEHAASFETRYWESDKEYWHMFWNNVVLLSIWVLMCWAIGMVRFFSVYVISASLASGMGAVLFAVQHSFEHGYGGDSRDGDCDRRALEGKSAR